MMSEQLNSYQRRAAFKRDRIWALLWRLDNRGLPNEGWVTMSQLYAFWLDGRDLCGIAYADDYIGPSQHVSYVLKRLVADGRAERRKRPGKHPEYRAVGPR